jgi:hypothetical protein
VRSLIEPRDSETRVEHARDARSNILVVYALRKHPVRDTLRDHLYSFARYSSNRCFYVNLGLRDIPRVTRRLRFQAVIFHTSFLSYRWGPESWRELVRRAAPLRDVGEIRVAIPQDEFLRSELLCEFIEDFQIGHVFSAAPASEWPKIYAGVDRNRVGFTRVLTGYLEPRSIRRAERTATSVQEREIDIGYRAWHAAPWLGRHGQLKHQLADSVRERAARHGLKVDISTGDEDTLFGDDWYRFLASCRYTIGVEGGASVLDRDGSLKEATERYLAEHPGAGFEEIEAACFPGEDGKLSLFAISPRHLEACATRTCQLLVEGDYNGVLRPDEHYLPLRRDLSNLDQVLEEVARDVRRPRIVEAAYRDVIASGRYEYSRLVERVEAVIPLQGLVEPGPSRGLAWAVSRARDRLSWVELRLRVGGHNWLARWAKRVLPDAVVDSIRRRRAARSARTAG